MSLKQLLKAAKAAIEKNDPEDGLYYANEALKLDRKCYFAYIFQGKSYQLQTQLDKAEASFEKAIALEPENLLGWKGYFQVAKSSSDFEAFFRILAKYVRVLVDQQIPLAETIKEVYNYLHSHKFQLDSALNEVYLRSVIPGTELGDLVGDSMGNPAENIRKLLNLLKTREDLEVRLALTKEKLRLPRVLTVQLKALLNDLEWSIRLKSNISELYKLYLTHSNDDDLRREHEIDFLKYKYTLLRISPEKDELRAEVKEMAADLVLLDSSDLFAWTLHFDLQDPKSFSDLDEQTVRNCIKKFSKEGLGVVLYLFVMSELCPFDREKFRDVLPSTTADGSTAQADDLLDDEPMALDDAGADTLSQTEILELMNQGHTKCPESMLANRIVCDYYIYLQEYETGSEKCSRTIRLLADLQRTYGVDLIHCKEDILCLLAVVYTYHEAPKNYSRALQLYNKILLDSPGNKQAMIGKGLILVAKRDLSSAKELLLQVVEENTSDPIALKELGWCSVLQGSYKEGRSDLEKSLNLIDGVSAKSFEMRASVKWRIAKSYLLEDSSNDALLKAAYDMLISSLKDHNSYAPSYTLLGVLYNDHFNDPLRAQKCFYKAFEFDISEVTAAKYLVKDLAEKGDWDISEILCKRVISSEKSKRILFSQQYDDPDKSWPYRVLGCSALNKQDDAKAIEWFQTALRMQAMDTECWTGLGEAYFNCGRVDAAVKVFQHTTKSDPTSWVNWYMLGTAVCTIGDYISGLEVLKKAHEMKPDATCILNALYEQLILHSSQLLMGGFVQRTLAANNSAIGYIERAKLLDSKSFSLWKALGECLRLICRVQTNIGSLPIEKIKGIFDGTQDSEDDIISLRKAAELFSEGNHTEALSMLSILSAKVAVTVSGAKAHKYVRSHTQMNLGLAYLDAFNLAEERNTIYRTRALEHFERAIRIEPENAQYWLAMGNAYVSFKPMLAQHCMIKASVYDQRDVNIWSNLAALYLRYGDSELSKEAFERATSIAPEKLIPWLGNALTAEVNNDSATYQRLCTHAYVLSNGRSPFAQLCYAISIVSNRIGNAKDARDVEAAQEFGIANFAIQNFLKFQPKNESGLKLAILLSERCQTYEISIDLGENLLQILEEKFEKTENSTVLKEFAVVKASLARYRLACGQYDLAAEDAQVAIDILSEETENLEMEQSTISSRIVLGLAHFFRKRFSDALEEFQLMLGHHSTLQTVVTLTAQVLYAINTEDSKQAAIDRLFEFIEENGSSLMIVLTLGAISLADRVADYYVPIKEELEGLALGELMEDNYRLVPKVLVELSKHISGQGGTFVWQKFALMFPSDYNIWKNLDSHMALSTAMLTESKRTALEVSDAFLKNATRREVQRALLVSADNLAARRMLLQPSLAS